MKRMRIGPAWETAQGKRARPQLSGSRQTPPSPHKWGGPATYPMVRRADPRVGRATRPSDAGRAIVTQFRAASLPPVSARPVFPPSGRGTGGRTDCKPMKRIGSHSLGEFPSMSFASNASAAVERAQVA